MRRLLLALTLAAGCAAPTAPEARPVQARADWKHKLNGGWTTCILETDTATVWINGVPYLELVTRCVGTVP